MVSDPPDGCGQRGGGGGLTFQPDDRGAVEVQQGGQGAAVRVVLQQVLHQGERGGVPLMSMLLPVAGLKP